MLRISIILSQLFLSLVCNTIAQQNILTFKNLSIDNGLSQNTINCIHQDKYGFMWFGTQDGLNRYDGYTFIQYRNERDNINSLSNNYIWDIYEDDEGILWIATFGGGLNKINPLTGEITCFKFNPDDSTSFPSNRLFSITESPKGILWIGGNEGLIRFNKKTLSSKIFFAQKNLDNVYKDNYVGIVTADESGNVWFRCDSGLTMINTKSLQVKYFRKSPYSNSIELGNVSDIKHINDVLLVTCSAGLLEINPKLKTDKLLLTSSTIRVDDQTPDFLRVLLLSNHHYAIGTNMGLILFDKLTDRISIYQNDPEDVQSISHNKVFSLFQSNDKVIWIGTQNGLNQIESETPDFIHIRNIRGKNGLSSKEVKCFIEDRDSLLWIGTTGGLNLYNLRSGVFKVFRSNGKNTYPMFSNYILCLFKDSKGNKWMGTKGGGFYKIENDKNSEVKITRVSPFNDAARGVSVHYITEDNAGFLWIGTGGAGLWKYNPSDNTVKKYFTAKDGTGPSHPYVYTILNDSYGNLWIGTPTGGLNLFNPQSEKFIYFQNKQENPNSISNNIILSLHEDKQSNLWIGTAGGLNKLIPKLGKNIFQKLSSVHSDSLFQSYSEPQGFPNDVIYGMLEDEHGKLWTTTNSGIAVFDMNEAYVIRTFDVSDGLQSNEFNQNGFFKNKDGLFFFGGINGFNICHPDSIKGNQFIPPIVLTRLSLFNEPVKVGSDSLKKFFLEKELHSIDEISLSWQQDVITFEFAALSYINPDKNQYSYMLEGFDKDWVQAGNIRSATYTNLDPGKYIFKVRASNSSGIWNQAGTALKIYISTPPWVSWYAYLFYAAIFISILVAYIQFRIKMATRELETQSKIEWARIEEREEVRKKSSADFHDEAGNRLTKISLFTELAKSESYLHPSLREYLNKIEENTKELSSGMRDFIWVLDPAKDSLYDTISRLKDFGNSMFDLTEIRFNVYGLMDEMKNIVLAMEARRALILIFKEAMNNCVKYSQAKNVELTCISGINFLEIMLKDDGKGFDILGNSNGYGINNMKNRAKKINYDLEIISGINKGTLIKLKMNIPHMSN